MLSVERNPRGQRCAGLVQADCAQWGAVFVLGDDCGVLEPSGSGAAFGTPPGDFDGLAGVNLKDYGAFQLCCGSSPGTIRGVCIFSMETKTASSI